MQVSQSIEQHIDNAFFELDAIEEGRDSKVHILAGGYINTNKEDNYIDVNKVTSNDAAE